MLFANSIIQEKVKSFFSQVLQNNRLAHAYLFYGKAGTGKTAFAFELAKALNCLGLLNRPCNECPACIKITNAQHADVKFIFPVSKSLKEDKWIELLRQKTKNPYKKMPLSGHLNIPIDSIRALKKEAMYAPYEAKKRVFIVTGIENFSREAANSFLKLLEEPPANLILILITNDFNSVLDTIRSRCQPVLFSPFSDEQIIKIVGSFNDNKIDITTAVRINQYNIENIIDFLEQPEDELRPLIVEFLRASALGNWLDLNQVIENILQTRDKNKAMEFINLMMLWLTDAYRLNLHQDESQLSNADMKDVISKFAKYYNSIDYSVLIERMEQAFKDIKGNMNTSLVLFNLAIEIKGILQAKIPA